MPQDLKDLVADLRERLAVARLGGSEAARTKHTDRGKLLVRDRVDALLDPGSAFLELSPLAATGMYGAPDAPDTVPSAGIVTGIGRVSAGLPERLSPPWKSCTDPLANASFQGAVFCFGNLAGRSRYTQRGQVRVRGRRASP